MRHGIWAEFHTSKQNGDIVVMGKETKVWVFSIDPTFRAPTFVAY